MGRGRLEVAREGAAYQPFVVRMRKWLEEEDWRWLRLAGSEIQLCCNYYYVRKRKDGDGGGGRAPIGFPK